MKITRAGAHVPTPRTLSIVVTSVASDAHTWNLVYLQLVLEELGHRVTNLGACVPDDLLTRECRLLLPDMIVISSVNGHGGYDGLRVIRRLRECPKLAHTPTIIGGKLGIGGDSGSDQAERLLQAGFDAVFDDCAGATQLRSFVSRLLPAAAPAHAASVSH